MNRLAPLALAALLLGAAPAAAETPITLDDALARAARANPDLVVAREDAVSAGADVTASRSRVLPKLDLTSVFGHNFRGPAATPRTIVDPSGEVVTLGDASDAETYALGLRFSQPLLDWEGFQDVSRARSQARAADRQLDETRLAVAFDVTRRFYDLLRAERTLAVLEKTVARSEELVASADALYAAGRAPRSETFTARVNLGNDRIAVEAQRAQVDVARAGLAEVLGERASADLSAVPTPAVSGPPAAHEPPPLEAVLATARERRPALAAQRALVAAADASVRAAQGGYLPTLTAQASYERQGPSISGAGGVYSNPSEEYQANAQVVFAWNLFEGRRTVAAVSRAESSARRARATQNRTEDVVVRELADARATAAARARQVALSAENLGTAEQALALARERLDAGLATQLDLRDASLSLTRAELSLVEARIDHAVAFADLARAAGGPF